MLAYGLCVLIGGCWFLVWRFGICGWVASLLLIGANYFGQIGGWLVLGFRWLIAGVVFGLLGVFGLGVFCDALVLGLVGVGLCCLLLVFGVVIWVSV